MLNYWFWRVQKNLIEENKPAIIFEHGIGASNYYGETPAKLFNYFASVSMKISTLDKYIADKTPLSKEEFKRQYYNKLNYYFIAHK